MKFLKYLGIAVIIVLFLIGVWMVVKSSVDKNEIVECNSWKSYSITYPIFYLEGWQKEQCDAHGIIISAPITIK